MKTDANAEPLTPADRVGDVPKIREAMARGIRAALRRHKQAGVPAAIWRDGAVVMVAPEDIPVEACEPSDTE